MSNLASKSTKYQYPKSGAGGALFYTCDLDDLDCRLELNGTNYFGYNNADI